MSAVHLLPAVHSGTANLFTFATERDYPGPLRDGDEENAALGELSRDIYRAGRASGHYEKQDGLTVGLRNDQNRSGVSTSSCRSSSA